MLVAAVVIVVAAVASLICVSAGVGVISIRTTNSEINDILEYTMFRDGSHSRSMRCATCDCATAVRASSETTSDSYGEDVALWVIIDTFEECNGLWVGNLGARE